MPHVKRKKRKSMLTAEAALRSTRKDPMLALLKRLSLYTL